MKSTLQSHMGVSLRDDRGRSLDAEIIELADDDLSFEDMFDEWDDIFVPVVEVAHGKDVHAEPTLEGEVVWMDELPTGRYPAVLPEWVEAEIGSSTLAS
jgi:hypothetical protein